jgi:hypothetical protein
VTEEALGLGLRCLVKLVVQANHTGLAHFGLVSLKERKESMFGGRVCLAICTYHRNLILLRRNDSIFFPTTYVSS